MSKADRTRQYIIEKVAPVFNRKGYAGTSLSEMEDATGLTKGSIYGNFKGGKDEVAVAAFDWNLELLRAELIKRIKAEDNALDKLRVYPRFYRRIFEKTLDWGGCVILNTVTDSDDGGTPGHELLYEKARKALLEWEMAIVHIIQKGMERGQVRADADPEKCAALIIALTEGGILLGKSHQDSSYLFRALDHIEYLIDSQLAP